jgi:hypothetical protein
MDLKEGTRTKSYTFGILLGMYIYFFSICFCTNSFLRSTKMGMISLIVIHANTKDHTHCVLFGMLIRCYGRCLYTWILA